MERFDGGHVRLDLSEFMAAQLTESSEPVQSAPAAKFFESRELGVVDRHDKFARDSVGDLVLVGELQQLLASFAAETSLERFGGVVQARVHDSRVAATLVMSELGLLLEHCQAQAGTSKEECACSRKTHQPRPDDCDVVLIDHDVIRQAGSR
jgi:hypothetical protein